MKELESSEISCIYDFHQIINRKFQNNSNINIKFNKLYFLEPISQFLEKALDDSSISELIQDRVQYLSTIEKQKLTKIYKIFKIKMNNKD